MRWIIFILALAANMIAVAVIRSSYAFSSFVPQVKPLWREPGVMLPLAAGAILSMACGVLFFRSKGGPWRLAPLILIALSLENGVWLVMDYSRKQQMFYGGHSTRVLPELRITTPAP